MAYIILKAGDPCPHCAPNGRGGLLILSCCSELDCWLECTVCGLEFEVLGGYYDNEIEADDLPTSDEGPPF